MKSLRNIIESLTGKSLEDMIKGKSSSTASGGYPKAPSPEHQKVFDVLHKHGFKYTGADKHPDDDRMDVHDIHQTN